MKSLSLSLTVPITFFISSSVIKPGLKITGIPFSTLTTVDSIPISHFPPFTIASTFPSNSCFISFTQVPLGLPDIFALGAARGQPDSSISCSYCIWHTVI